MSQNNNQAARKNLGAFSKAIQPQRKPLGSWSHLTNKVDTKPGASKSEKVNFLNGFAIGMIAAATLPELQALKGLQGLKGESLNKLPDFKSMTDSELNSWIDKYSALVDKL